jgi:hypothetical protein
VQRRLDLDRAGAAGQLSTMGTRSQHFLFNKLTAHVSLLVSVHIYVSSSFVHLPAQILGMIAGSLVSAWALMYAARRRDEAA